MFERLRSDVIANKSASRLKVLNTTINADPRLDLTDCFARYISLHRYREPLILQTFLLGTAHILVYALVAVGVSNSLTNPLFLAGFAALLIWMSISDFNDFTLPDTAQALLAVHITAQLIFSGASLPEHLFSASAWASCVWLVGLLYQRLRGWFALGFGDVKLMANIGLLLGFEGTGRVLLLASVSAAISLGVVHWALDRRQEELLTRPIAFGPFLCLFTWATYLSGIGQ